VGREIVENLGIVLSIAVVATFILIAGYMIGSASAYNNNFEKERQFQCIEHGGHMEYVNNVGIVCKK